MGAKDPILCGLSLRNALYLRRYCAVVEKTFFAVLLDSRYPSRWQHLPTKVKVSTLLVYVKRVVALNGLTGLRLETGQIFFRTIFGKLGPRLLARTWTSDDVPDAQSARCVGHGTVYMFLSEHEGWWLLTHNRFSPRLLLVRAYFEKCFEDLIA